MGSVYIPLEVTKRELDSKLLLATQIATTSIPVIVGNKGPVFEYAKKSKYPGIFFYKSVQESYFDTFKRKDFFVVAQDEEAGIILDSYNEWAVNRTSWTRADLADLFFTWGDEEYEYLIKKLNYSSNSIINSGAARVSLWGKAGRTFYSDEIRNINKKYGKFILIALTGPLEGYYFFRSLLKQIKVNSQSEIPAILSTEKYQNQLILTLVSNILADTTLSVVIRPHPADMGTKWTKLARANPRIHVSLDGSSTPWIHSSEGVIHTGSTVGIESIVAKKPTFNIKYGFFFKTKQEILTNWQDKLNLQIKDYDDLKSKLQNLDSYRIDHNNSEYLKSRLKNVDNLDAVKVITKELLNLHNSKNLELGVKPKLDIKLYLFTRFFYWTLFFTNRRLYVHNKYKRPRITKKYVLSKVEASREILNIKDNIKVKTLADSCFLIYRSD